MRISIDVLHFFAWMRDGTGNISKNYDVQLAGNLDFLNDEVESVMSRFFALYMTMPTNSLYRPFDREGLPASARNLRCRDLQQRDVKTALSEGI